MLSSRTCFGISIEFIIVISLIAFYLLVLRELGGKKRFKYPEFECQETITFLKGERLFENSAF